ncbi:DUF6049 family protein [Williamsia sp. CHRR-6]|uniref:DUF6049 family protein n=1 Tax=Williamsia sp. CHRR-6 TaxID=2835871 RepID=UPI001BD91C2F|nr:DUF6049 family protein [Williamsia sp. CHRR-6]MBT0567755.1 hypothetical protein [Williamsia sp. CHRR-6]
MHPAPGVAAAVPAVVGPQAQGLSRVRVPTAVSDLLDRSRVRAGALLAVVALTLLCAAPGFGGAARADATPFPDAARFVEMDVESLTPSIVTAGSGTTVTVTGSLRNIGDRPVTDLIMRLQRGARVDSGAGLRTGLTVDPAEYDTVTPFRDVTTRLDPGQRRAFALSVPLSGAGGLGIDQPGIYPLLVNLNGTPDYGAPARLDDSRTLLTVQGTPGAPGAAPITPTIGSPSAVTVMWPLAATPQVAPGRPGGTDEPVRLASEDLATSLRPGGRLNGLLTTVDEATAAADSALTRSTCLAIDPDLLLTVQAMTAGYRVALDPSDPQSRTREGTGTAAAQEWLQRLRTTAARLCVVALPFAQADLDSLARAGDPALIRIGVSDPAEIVDSILGISSLRGVAVPVTGALATTTATMLDRLGMTKALVASSSVRTDRPSADGRYRVGDTGVQTFDPAVTTALAALGTAPSTPAITPMNQRFNLTTESAVSRRVAAIGALTYSALVPSTSVATTDRPSVSPVVGRSDLIMPPPVWSASADDARAVLDTIGGLLSSGLATPAPLGMIDEQLKTTSAQADWATPADTTLGLVSFDDAMTTPLTRAAGLTFQLEASMIGRNDGTISPQAFVDPLAQDLVRAMRAAPVTSAGDRTVATTQAVNRVRAVASTLDRLRDSVRILDPGGRYTLASERSPLLLVVRNELPVPIRVRLDTAAPPELDIGDIGVLEIPARGTRQIQLPTEARSSSSMSVNIALVTSSGVAMGTPITLSVHSNAYGQALFIITICAGVLLVLLAGRRLWHRFRGQPDPADLDR